MATKKTANATGKTSPKLENEVKNRSRIRSVGSKSTPTIPTEPSDQKPQPTPETLKEGMKLPAASLVDQDGKACALSGFKGSWLVLYFYPKDDTPGCTREACSFQENLGAITRMKANVVGISSDSAARHRKFADKYQLSFPLLVDEDRAFAVACGVVGEKVLYGKRSLGVIRTTFIVDDMGIVRRVFRKVRVEGHTEEVLDALRSLRKK